MLLLAISRFVATLVCDISHLIHVQASESENTSIKRSDEVRCNVPISKLLEMLLNPVLVSGTYTAVVRVFNIIQEGDEP